MPAVIDMMKEVAIPKEQRNLESGVHLELGEQRDVVLTKFVSTDPKRACWAPEGEWEDEVTVDVGGGRRSVRIGVRKPDGELRSVNIDDGLIIRLYGTMSRIVGMLPGQPPMDEAAVEAYIDQTEKQVPLFQQWDFRVKWVKKTNGPEARFALHKSEDQKRQQSQTDLFEALKQMFQSLPV